MGDGGLTGMTGMTGMDVGSAVSLTRRRSGQEDGRWKGGRSSDLGGAGAGAAGARARSNEQRATTCSTDCTEEPVNDKIAGFQLAPA
jgi:hypothetical protein